MSQIRFVRFSQVHLERFFPGVPRIFVARIFSRRARFGVSATDDRDRFLFCDVGGRSAIIGSFITGELISRRSPPRRRLPTTGSGRIGWSFMGDVDSIRCADFGGVVGEFWLIGGIAMLFFFRATGGRGGFLTKESMDFDDGIFV